VCRAETPWAWEVAITSRISSLVCALSQVPAIGPTNPHSFFSQDRQFDGEVGQGAFLLLEFVFEGRVDFAADLALLASGLGPEALERPFLDLLPDTGQIGGEKPFAAEQFAHGLVAVLGFQIDLELFLGIEITPFLGRTRIRGCG